MLISEANLTFLAHRVGGTDMRRGVRFFGFITWGAGGTFILDRYALFFKNPAGGTVLDGRVRL